MNWTRPLMEALIARVAAVEPLVAQVAALEAKIVELEAALDLKADK